MRTEERQAALHLSGTARDAARRATPPRRSRARRAARRSCEREALARRRQSRGAVAAKRSASSATRSRRRRPERHGRARQLRVPRVERRRRTAPLLARPAAARCAGAAPPAGRGGGGVGRVERGGERVQMRTPPRRAALDQQQALGHEDEDLACGRAARPATRPRRRPSARACPGPARSPPRAAAACGAAAELELHAREALAPADELLVRLRPRRAAAQREPGPLEEVGLAGGVGADDDVQAVAEAHRRVAVRAEVDEPQRGRRTHAILLTADGDHVARLQRAAAARLHLAVHRHLAVLDEQLGMSSGRGRAGELEERPQGEWAR